MAKTSQRIPTLSQQSTQETITEFIAGSQSKQEHTGQVAQTANLRELCRCVSEERDSERMKVLLDELYLALDERELLASLL